MALKCEPYELLMRPEAAMALRRLRENAIKIAADSQELRTGTGG